MSRTGGVQQFIYGEFIEPLLQICKQQKQSFCTSEANTLSSRLRRA
jgi:hypothetical protein